MSALPSGKVRSALSGFYEARVFHVFEAEWGVLAYLIEELPSHPCEPVVVPESLNLIHPLSPEPGHHP